MLTPYEPESGPAFEAIQRAVDYADRRPPALERLFRNNGAIGVDWSSARRCHHSNEIIVAAVGGMIDAAMAEAVLGPSCRLPAAVNRVPSLDGTQQGLFLAAANDARRPRDRLAFAEALNEIIELERLQVFFERGRNAAIDHYDIRPFGHAAAQAVSGGPGELERTKMRAKDLAPEHRIPLLAICSLYNGYDARDVFKGRGWIFHGAELGGWLRKRFATNEPSACAMLRALGHYCGW